MVLARPESFLSRHKEQANYNQYWYSDNTISAIIQEVSEAASSGEEHIAFLSTPSLFFSLPQDSPAKANSVLFDLDEGSFGSDPAFVRYDFNQPEQLPGHLLGAFSLVVIDPPFITEGVWRKYATTVRLLLGPSGRVICSTVAENAALMQELFGATACAFKPSIPHLVYQYSIFCSYLPTQLSQRNPEVPEDD